MVRGTLTLVFVFLFCCGVTGARGWDANIGVQVGGALTRAQYESDYFDGDSSYGPGLFVGIITIVPFGARSSLALESGLLFYQRGGETEFQFVRTDPEEGILWERTDTYDWRLGYMGLPLLLRYSFSEEGGLYVKAGPELAFLHTAELEKPVYDSESIEEPEAEYVVVNARDTFNFYDVLVIGAVGYVFPAGGLSGFVEVSYVVGLRDVFHASGAASDPKMKNSSVGLSLGVLFETRI
jgi:hypothetical protein